jgi:parallel beta-helix repeat protein
MNRPAILVAVALAACSSSSNPSPPDAPPADAAGPASVTLTPGSNDQATVQAALIAAKKGQTIYFSEGTYMFDDELSLSVAGVTLAGKGDEAKVILDFSKQATAGGGAANGLHVSAGDFILQNLTVRDTAGDGIRIDKGVNVTLRKVKIFWSRGSKNENGGYAFYPVGCTNVLIEDCEVHGASDAGIYVGQSTNIMVRRNMVSGNVNGIEIENSIGAEVTGNMVTDNVGGILVFNLPHLPVKTGSKTVVHDNTIVGNNRDSFATGGNVASYVPSGTGLVILAADQTEIRNNTVTGNRSTGLVIGACTTLANVSSGGVMCDDPPYDSVPEGMYVHDNTFSGNGTAPQGFFPVFWADQSKPFQDISWDGVVPTTPTADSALCIQNNPNATFVKVDPVHIGQNQSYDLAPYNCSHPPVPGINVTWGGAS